MCREKQMNTCPMTIILRELQGEILKTNLEADKNSLYENHVMKFWREVSQNRCSAAPKVNVPKSIYYIYKHTRHFIHSHGSLWRGRRSFSSPLLLLEIPMAKGCFQGLPVKALYDTTNTWQFPGELLSCLQIILFGMVKYMKCVGKKRKLINIQLI